MAVDQWQACIEQLLTHWTVIAVLKLTRWLVPMRDWKLRMALMHGTPRGHVHSHGWCVAVALGLTQHGLFCTYAGIKESCVLQMLFLPWRTYVKLTATPFAGLLSLCVTGVKQNSRLVTWLRWKWLMLVPFRKTTINSNQPLKINVQPISNRYCAALIQLWRAFLWN